MALDIGEPALEAIVFESESLVIQPEKVQNGGVEVIKRVDIFHCSLPQFIGHSVTDAGLYACSREPAGKAIRVVIPSLGTLLEEGHPSKLGTPYHERIFQ